MARPRATYHSHPCADCGTPVDCDGDLDVNEDGWPSVICRSYHLTGGAVAEPVCEACAAARAIEPRASEVVH